MQREFDFRSRHLAGESFRGSPATAPCTVYDLGLFVSAWEERCMAISASPFTFRVAGLIAFEHGGEVGIDSTYDSSLRRFLGNNSQRVHELRGSVDDLEYMSSQMMELIRGQYRTTGRPISLLIDITCFPKYHFLSVMGSCFIEGLCSKIDFFYAEGQYEQTSERTFSFTTGDWESVVIPHFEGAHDPEKKRFFLVALGFEGQRAFRFVSKYEPNRISALIPDPGFFDEYTGNVYDVNRSLLDQYRIPVEQQVRVRAGDAIEAWAKLNNPGLHRFDKENTTYLCLGTKPHALAMGLRALTEPGIEIVYSKPQRFSKAQAIFTGTAWLYSIRDLSLAVQQ